MQRMPRWAGGFLAMALAAAGAPGTGAAAPAFEVQLVVLKLPNRPGGELVAEPGFKAKGGKAEPDGSWTWLSGTTLTLRQAGSTLRAFGERLLLDGDELAPERWGRPGSDIAVASWTHVTLRAGDAPVQLKAETHDPVQYLVAREDGLFAVATAPETPRMELHLQLDRAEADSVHVLWRLLVVQLGRRERIRGLLLDVGKPRILEGSGSSDADLPLGGWSLLAFQPGDAARSYLAILMRVTRKP